MTAATLAGDRAVTTLPLGGAGAGGDVKASWGTVTVDAATEDGDIFQVCYVPAGATVIGGMIYGGDGDTGIAVLDIMCGWAANGDEVADPDGFSVAGVWDGTNTASIGTENVYSFGGVLVSAGPKTFNADTLIQLETNTAADSGVAMEVTVVVYYLYNNAATPPEAPV